MRGKVICDNIDTLFGMRLAGIEGVVVHERAEMLDALHEVMQSEETAVVFLTEKLTKLCEPEIEQIKETVARPLLVTIPDRHGSYDLTAAISRYLAETVGIHI